MLMGRFRLLWTLALLAALTLTGHAVQQPATPTGIITGTITDESGNAVMGARVQAVGRGKKWMGPYFEIPTGRPDESDDRGQFRLHSLPPGEYVVAVSLQPNTTPQSTSTGYLRTYNPATTSLADAQPISLKAGEERSALIRVTPVRFVDVKGTVTTSTGERAANFSVWLKGSPATIGYTGIQSGFMTTMVATAATEPDGSFSLVRIPPGTYTLIVTNGHRRAGRPLEMAEIPLGVKDTPITGVTVTTARGATVSGRLEWAGRGPAPWPRSGTLGRIRATQIGGESDFASLDSEVQGDGTFRFTDLYGLRRIQALNLRWPIQAVDAPNGVLTGPNLRIKLGTDITDVKVVVTDRTGTLMATVADEEGKPLETGSLLLMPKDPSDIDPLGWGYQATQRNRASGGVWYYAMDGVLPGSYLAVAIDVEPYRLTNDADLLERARAAAVPIEVRVGQMPLALRVVRLRPFVRN
jgi:hypothetical protein